MRMNQETLYAEIISLRKSIADVERQHSLDILNTQMKYDIALDMVGNQCGNYYIDSLQDGSSFLELVNCSYSPEQEEIR
jgi:hypothetical protein